MQDLVDTLIGDIYETALDPSKIRTVIRQLADLTGSTVGVLCLHGENRILHEVIEGLDEAWAGPNRELQHQNLYFQRRHLLPTGRAVVGEQFAPLQDWQGLELYHDVKIPSGCIHFLGIPIESTSNFLAEISLYRPETEEIHGDRELDIANHLVPHFARAFHVAQLAEEGRSAAAGLSFSLDHLNVGCMIINESGRLIFANKLAEMHLSGDGALCMAAQHIIADGGRNEKNWRGLLHRLASRTSAKGSAVMLTAKDGTPVRLVSIPLNPYKIEVFSLPLPACSQLGLVLIEMPWSEGPDTALLLQQLFGLTPTEAELARALLNDERMGDYAARSERSLNTVKTHLKSIFAKTDTKRQAELMRKLSSLLVMRNLSL